MKCPKCGYEPTMSEIQTSPDDCPKCGINYEGYDRHVETEKRTFTEKLSIGVAGARESVDEGRQRRAEDERRKRDARDSDSAMSVVVVDIRMNFWSMVFFMVKWVIASIPAVIILFLIFLFISGFFGGLARFM